MANSTSPQTFSSFPGTMPLTKNINFSRPHSTPKSARKKLAAIALAFVIIMFILIIVVSLLRKGSDDNSRDNNSAVTFTPTPTGTPEGTPTPTEIFKADCFNTCSDGEFLEFAQDAISKLKSYKAEGSEQLEDYASTIEAFFEKGYWYKELTGNFASNRTIEKTFAEDGYLYIISEDYEESVLKDRNFERKPNETDVNSFFKSTLEFLVSAYGSNQSAENIKDVKLSVTETIDGSKLRKYEVITQEGTNTDEQTISEFWFNEAGLLIKERDDAGLLNGVYSAEYSGFDQAFNVLDTYKSVKREVLDNI